MALRGKRSNLTTLGSWVNVEAFKRVFRYEWFTVNKRYSWNVPFYFYLLNVFLGAWIILNYFSHTVFVLLLSALRFQGRLCGAAHGGFTAQNPRGSLHVYLLSVAYFHTVTHCGLICRLPPETQCTESLHSPVLRDLSGPFPGYLERRCHGWLWEEPFSHQSLHFFPPIVEDTLNPCHFFVSVIVLHIVWLMWVSGGVWEGMSQAWNLRSVYLSLMKTSWCFFHFLVWIPASVSIPNPCTV